TFKRPEGSALEQRADDRGGSSFRGGLGDDVGLEGVREAGERDRLQPHLAGTAEQRHEQPVAAEQLVADARDRRQVEADRRLEQADMTRMDTKLLPLVELERDHLAVQLDERAPAPRQLLEEETLPAEDADAE